MFLNILKKDLKRKKSMNIILFVFITLCAAFMASSIGNLSSVLNAIDYFSRQTNISDYFIFKSDENSSEFEAWLATNQYVTGIQKETGIIMKSDNLLLPDGNYETVGLTTLNKLPEKYNLVLDSNNEPLSSIKNGEIAMTRYDADRTGVKLNDSITIILGEREKTLTVTYLVKDMIYGSQYMDNNRFILSTDDYDYFSNAGSASFTNFYSIMCDDMASFGRDLHRQNFQIYYDIDKSGVNAIFTMDMVVASILIVVSVCLIIISLVILRFTIVFTLQDDYREIGVMKAIGLRNAYIKRLYIVKYLALSIIGSVTGVCLSIPFGNMLTEDLKKNIAMESAGNPLIGILCGLGIVLIVMIFCWLSAGGVNKFTAIQAIRSGSTGERFKNRRFFYLNKRRKISVTLFLAFNSIISALKSYGVLIITFIIGTMLVILPLNAVNTLSSSNIIELFGISKSDAYIENSNSSNYIADGVEYMLEDIDALCRFYSENGIDVIINPISMVVAPIYIDNPDENYNALAFKSYVYDASVYKSFIDGTPPLLPNEIAVTEKIMKKLGVEIGDSVYLKFGEAKEKFLITASFQSMNNMGDSMLFASAAEMDIKYATGFILQCDFVSRNDIDGQIAKLRELTPSFTIKTVKEYTDTYVGSIADTIDSMKIMLLCVVLFINCLITVLLMRTFITKEKGEISLIKNIGFKDKFIRRWQILRIMITLFVSIIAGALLSNAFNSIMAKYTFGLMGAPKVMIEVIPFEVYFLYPVIIFTGTSIAAIISAGAVRKVSFKEINNVE